MNMATHTDHLAQTIDLIRSTQGYPMLVLRNIEEPNGNTWKLNHYLAVKVGEREIIIYKFMVNRENNWLTSIKTSNVPFEQILQSYADEVLYKSCYATLEVLSR